MFKRISSFALAMTLSLSIWVQQAAALEGPSIFVDGAQVEAASAFLYQETMYVSLYNVTLALRPDAVITWEGDHALVTAEGLSLTAYPGARYLQVNGRYLYLPYGVRSENGDTMVPVRTLTQALGAQLWWEASDGNVYLTRGTGAILSGGEYYSEDAVYWLSHIIYAESGSQPLEGKIAVGNVILNRVRSSSFPNTVEGVIFDRKDAVQFEPVSNGRVYLPPASQSVEAAKRALDGENVVGSALYFYAPALSQGMWINANRPYQQTIGCHRFYR